MFEQLYGNLYIDSNSFTDFDQELIFPLIEYIAKDIDNLTYVPDVERVFIRASPFNHSGETEIAPLFIGGKRAHELYILIQSGDKNCKFIDWIDQFSHEYMHHVIDRRSMFRRPPTLWFDEALCDVSSIIQALRIERLLRTFPDKLPFPSEYVIRVFEIVRQLCKHGDTPVSQSIRSGNGIGGFLPVPLDSVSLAQYGASVASCIYQLFVINPNLWKMVQYIHQVPLDADIFALLDHLRETADDSYRGSLDEMIKILFP